MSSSKVRGGAPDVAEEDARVHVQAAERLRVAVSKAHHVLDERLQVGAGDAESRVVDEGAVDARTPWAQVFIRTVLARTVRLDAVLVAHDRVTRARPAVIGQAEPQLLDDQ